MRRIITSGQCLRYGGEMLIAKSKYNSQLEEFLGSGSGPIRNVVHG
jgi:hypothetical protein